MRALLLITAALIGSSCASNPTASSKSEETIACTTENKLPMFGYDADHKLNRCDQAFLDEIDKATSGRREPAIQRIREAGYRALENDPTTAAKRFNQAWLLDRNDPETMRAFMDWETKMGHKERADQFRDRTRLLEKL